MHFVKVLCWGVFVIVAYLWNWFDKLCAPVFHCVFHSKESQKALEHCHFIKVLHMEREYVTSPESAQYAKCRSSEKCSMNNKVHKGPHTNPPHPTSNPTLPNKRTSDIDALISFGTSSTWGQKCGPTHVRAPFCQYHRKHRTCILLKSTTSNVYRPQNSGNYNLDEGDIFCQ